MEARSVEGRDVLLMAELAQFPLLQGLVLFFQLSLTIRMLLLLLSHGLISLSERSEWDRIMHFFTYDSVCTLYRQEYGLNTFFVTYSLIFC